MKKKVTLDDIALDAGVSKATVSYVLSGKRKVSKEVTQKILKIANAYGYNSVINKQQKESKKQEFIGFLLLPNNVKPDEDYFVFSMLEGIHTKLQDSGFFLAYKRLKTIDIKDKELISFINSVKGLILLNPRDDEEYIEFINYLKSRKKKYVLIGTPADERTYYVDVDIESASYQAADLLINKNCSDITFITTPSGMKQSAQMLQGFELAHTENNLQWNEDKVLNVCEISIDEGIRIAEDALSMDPQIDGFITPNDILARGVIIALQRNKIQIPSKCKVVSLGGGVISEKFSYPKITAIDYNPLQIGYEAITMLLDIIMRKRMKPSHFVFPATLCHRETT